MPFDSVAWQAPRLAEPAAALPAPPIPACRAWAARYDGRHGPLMDLTQAVPSGPPHPEMLARLGAAASNPSLAGYGPLEGEAPLCAAVAEETGRLYGGDVAAGDVRVAAGANLAFTLAMSAIAAPGEEVILPLPWFFNHAHALALRGVVPRALPAGPGLLPRAADAAALVTPRTRAIVLVTPGNPTGAAIPAEEIARFHDLCRARGLWLVLDETYRDFLPEGHGAPHELFARPGWRDGVVQIVSFSKAYSIPGHRMASVVAGPAFRAAFLKAVDNIQICPPRPPQAALAWAIPALRDWRAERAAAIEDTRRGFAEALDALDGFHLDAEGAYFAWLRIPPGALDARAAAECLASRHGVVVLPGSAFGPGNERHLRLSTAMLNAARTRELCRRLADFARSPDCSDTY